jgi:hypothetical protein
MVLARGSVFRLGYFSGFFLSVIIVLTILLYCTFRSTGLLSLYIYIYIERERERERERAD